MAFLEDPRLRQRWNQISHNAETVTESAAEGIWTFQHRFLNPCLGALVQSFESCTAPCCGGAREERARRARAREHRAEYTFDFYDDWDDDDEVLARGGYGAGFLGGWGSGGGGGGGVGGGGGGSANSRGEDWDRLIGGSGAGAGSRKGSHAAEVADQPKRKRGMSYGTRGVRRKATSEEEDPTIIPSTAPLGFLGRLPWKIGGTLRYKPSTAFLQDHPGASSHPDENVPLLDSDGDDDFHAQVTAHIGSRQRSGTGGSGDTSDSFRSRGDLFPSDGEGEEDAVPLDDEFAVALNRADLDSESR